MTDARPAHYEELYPALNGLSANRVDTNASLLNHNNSNNNNNSNTNNNNTNPANSWSAHTAASGHQHHQQQQQNKLNYIQQLQYQQHQQQQHQTNPTLQNHDQSQQQQVLNHLVESSKQSNTIVAQQHHTLQQQQQQFVANNIANNQTMQNNTSLQQPPPLPQQAVSMPVQQQQQQQAARKPGAPSHPMLSERSCTFKIGPEERRHRDLEQAKILKDIMQRTSTKIEITTTKDGSLSFCIIGKEWNLPVAKNLVMNEFQTGVTLTVSVPKSIHRRLLGQKGQRLMAIQDETLTKITIPRKEEESDIIKIFGLKSNAEAAVRAIEKCAREFAGKTVEKVTVERIYLLFITGPFNENLKRWEEMGAKVSTSGGLLPSNNDRESGHADEVTFTIIGDVTAVSQVKEEINRIYEDKKKKCTTVNIEVKKAQHKYILGQAGHNLRQLFAKTGVSVELPQESESETITLRGERSKIAPALSELYTQAHSETDDYFEVDSWLHKYLIGPKKTNFLDFKALGVEVKSLEDKIKLHGPPTEIENIMDVFEAELDQLKKNIIRKDINVEPRIHGYIIGRSGATVDQIRDESGANVIVPKNDELSELITLEGTHEAVAIAEEKINAIAKRYEASRKLVIDQQLHGSIIGRGGEKIRSIREKFSQIVFSFPEQGSKHNEITIVGPADEVEECYKYLEELHQQIQENNHQLQVPIKKDVVKFLNDAKKAIQRIKIDHQVKIDLFVNESGSPELSGAAPASDKKTAGGKQDANNKSTEDSKQKKSETNKQNTDNNTKKTSSSNKGSSKQTNGVSSDNNKDTKNPEKQQKSATKNANEVNNKSESGPALKNLENYAIIIGKKENVDLAKPKFVKLMEEFATTIEVEIKMATYMREQLGPKSKNHYKFCDEFQNKVTVVYPPMQRASKQQQQQQQVSTGDDAPSSAEDNGKSGAVGKMGVKNKKANNKEQTGDNNNNNNKSNNENVSYEVIKLRGPKQLVKKAEKRFETLITECHKNYTIKFNVDANVYEKFVLTDKLKLKTIRDTLSVKLHIPDKREGVKQLVCTIVGYEKDALEAQKQFDKLMKEVAERVEETIEIPNQVHPRLIGAGGRAVKKLMDDYNISVKFARPGDPNPNAVTLYGSQKNIDSAKSYMQKTSDQFMTMAAKQQQQQQQQQSQQPQTQQQQQQ